MMSKGANLELYIHIPFCIRKCLYCDFLSFPADAAVIELYIKRLTEEIRAAGEQYQDRRVVSLFLGGGTPTLILPEQTGRILAAVKDTFCLSKDAEITAEANPGTLDREKLALYRAFGINRLSLGLQSAREEELRVLGRIHSFEDFLMGFQMAREAGFTNLNVDIMSALPGQSLASYQQTLNACVALSPEHISAYSLIIEEGTPFFERYGCGDMGRPKSVCTPGEDRKVPYPCLPGEDEEREMYHETKTYLKKQGYERYEISNYARPGFECRHNLGYWTGIEYLGLGLGAASCMGGERFSNESDLKTYLNTTSEEFSLGVHRLNRQKLTEQEKMEEFMFLGLRLMKGVSEGEFLERFGLSVQEVYKDKLPRLIDGGLLRHAPGGRLCLTDYGIDVSNVVLSKFLLD